MQLPSRRLSRAECDPNWIEGDKTHVTRCQEEKSRVFWKNVKLMMWNMELAELSVGESISESRVLLGDLPWYCGRAFDVHPMR